MMRLLVYGGTQYSERRRVGDWPATISSEILQSRQGLSEQRTVYGVGLLDHSPFILVRRMQTHDRRAYPITVLLDPGSLWPDFGWNGALVLQAILHDFPKVGRALLAEPETIASAEDLKRLLSPLLRRGPATDVSTDINGAGDRFTHFWTGCLTLKQPMVVGLVSNSLGLERNPQYKNMAERIELLPESLRCGVGWVVGGDKVYSSVFNTHLVFEDSQQSEPALEEEISNTVSRGKTWLEAWRNVEASAPKLKSDELNELFQQQLFSWERNNAEKYPVYGRQHLFIDLRCLSSLLSPLRSVEKTVPEITDRFKDLFLGVQPGPLNELIEQTFGDQSRKSNKHLTPEETRLVLRKALEQNDPSFDLGMYGERLDPKAVINYLVEHRIYPSTLGLPQHIQIEATERLLDTEQIEDLQNKLSEEVAWLRGLAPENRLRLVSAAVNRSAESSDGMDGWLFYRNGSALSKEISTATAEAGRRGLENRIGSWEQNYFVFGGDRNGSVLLTSTPDVIERVVRVALEASQIISRRPENIQVRALAEDWLKSVGRSKLRTAMPLDLKIDVARAGLSTWHGLRALCQAFGQPEHGFDQSDVNIIEPDEQPFMIHELFALVQRVSNETDPPNLRTVAELFSFDEPSKESIEFAAVLGPLLEIQPDLSRITAPAWVNGWLELSPKILIATTKERFYEKFQVEAVRWLLSDREPDTWGFSLKDLSLNDDKTHLRNLLMSLLFSEESKKDAIYARRILTFKSEIKKVLGLLASVLESGLSSEAGRSTFFRRFGTEQRAFEAIQKALYPETAQILESAREQYVEERTDWYRLQIRDLFWADAERRQCAAQFVELAAESKDAGPDNQCAFDEAVRIAFEEIPPGCEAVFVERFVNKADAFKIINDRLDPLAREALQAHRSEHENLELSQKIESLLLGGQVGQLAGLLTRQVANGRLSQIATAAVRKCLNPVSRENRFYQKVLLVRDKGVEILPIKRAETINNISRLFAVIEPRARWEILNFTLNLDAGSFNKMVIRELNAMKKHGDENDEYKKSVFAFLWTEAGKNAKEQLFIGSGAGKKLEKYLAPYKELAQQMNDPPRDEDVEPSIFGRILGL